MARKYIIGTMSEVMPLNPSARGRKAREHVLVAMHLERSGSGMRSLALREDISGHWCPLWKRGAGSR